MPMRLFTWFAVRMCMQGVDKRKVKIGGKAKAEIVNQRLDEFQIKAQQGIQDVKCQETKKLVTEALSKIKGLKVKNDKKREKDAIGGLEQVGKIQP